ncbi:hypothetical protein Y032_0335g2859 [Ancylostoma ceylanicum]|uniref:SCP domain-containing protein n=1 Tax=Ancylostoma ceylanicum TaxID=53326 RepID=A0A016RZM7_9BILA|nr:hypothetical protein Y032_0335g2859 [Ancylostoma ceylanicum]
MGETRFVSFFIANGFKLSSQALTRWWGQLARNGVPSNMIFSEAVRNRQTGIVTKFTKVRAATIGTQFHSIVIILSQMAWWDNINLGCAVRNCNSFYFTSCMYGPGGNIVGSSIYTIGAVCSGCPAGCVGGLCPAP